MTRLKANRELLRLLSQVIEANKDLRWNQLLEGFLFTNKENYDFYTESETVLKIIKKSMSEVE